MANARRTQAEALDQGAWARNASLMALLANINRKKGSRALTPDDFMPRFGRSIPRRPKPMKTVGVEALAKIFGGGSPR